MNRAPRFRPPAFALLAVLTTRAPALAEDLLAILPRLRISECGAPMPGTGRWRPDAMLDKAAERWSRGETLHRAVENSGYIPTAAGALHVTFANATEPAHVSRDSCAVLLNPALREAGVYRHGLEYWIVFASRAELPVGEDSVAVARQILLEVNRARARGRRCGSRWMPSVAPLRTSALLSAAAGDHARDMANHHYVDHRDREGRLPVDRVVAVGYRERLVGENIAVGALSTQDAMQGWLASPAHCQNLMDARFQEMGVAFAQAREAERNVYWVQVLARPR